MTTSGETDAGIDPVGRLLLALAAVAVAFAAADTYVVVLALPEMMTASGLSAEQLQEGAPIISGFLLGYVGALPLVGRIADLRGRIPVLVGSMVAFAVGSMVTASAYDLGSMVAGRVLQGIGGGGLVPATLALVADLYPPRRRGIPLGIVNGVQEFGNVVGPLYGAVVLAFGTWRDIFWINLAVGLVIAAVIRQRGRSARALGAPPRRRTDWLGLALTVGSLACVLLVMLAPARLTEDVTLGTAFLPIVGGSRWLAPLGVAAVVLAALLVVRCFTAAEPLLDLRAWRRLLRGVDLLGASLLAIALAGIIVAFATADPEKQLVSAAGPWLLLGSAAAAVAFWRRNATADNALVPPGTLRATPAWGAMVVSFFAGSALIAALVDIPIFARITIYGESQLLAALVLVRFLVGLPIGAVLGGWWTHHAPAGLVAATGMALSCGGFLLMTQWGLDTLHNPWATVPLVMAGTGVGLAIPPVNAALLAATHGDVHGVASALLIVARTVGKLVGISALTTIGLRVYYRKQADLPAPQDVCPGGQSKCDEFAHLLRVNGLVELHTIFLGAAVCCVIGGAVALLVFRDAATREVRGAAFQGEIG
ncbi:MAG TPA: MFS transporter [Marmoricola sp.]|nr:MFS transporter [Marmoricola sp.]